MESSVIETTRDNITHRHPLHFTTVTGFRLAGVVSLFFLTLMTGCATTSFPVMGIRPNYPKLSPSPEAVEWCKPESDAKTAALDAKTLSCTMYRNYHEYANQLAESYRSRATLNEWGLYFAGLVGLSGLSATAGLAATNAGIQALRIVPLVTGFVSGTTAVVENKDKALNYTTAANKIGVAICNADRITFSLSPSEGCKPQLGGTPKPPTQQTYQEAFAFLSGEVTVATNELELSRVELAARDKNIEKLVDELTRKRLPTQFRLDDDDVEVEEEKEVKVHVMDGRTVDPNRTKINDKDIADFIHEPDNKTIIIKGRKAGSTRMRFWDKDGISANLIVVVKPKTITKTEGK
jgi:hypothetical protein